MIISLLSIEKVKTLGKKRKLCVYFDKQQCSFRLQKRHYRKKQT